MPTGKKAAPKAVRAKKTTVKKTAVKKRTTKLRTKAASASSQKAKSITIKNKTQESSAANERQTEFADKLKKLEALRVHPKGKDSASKDVKARPQKLKKTIAKPKKHSPILQHTKRVAALALLSPYRFPIDPQKVAVATARYGGVFFVAIGALFTLWFADISFGSYSMLANVSFTESTTTTSDGTQTNVTNSGSSLDCFKPENFLNSQCANVVDKTPVADISINNQTALKGSVQIKIKVPFAESVTLSAYDRTQRRDVTLGRATKMSSDTWEIYWRTNEYDDGDYKLKALIKNGYGAYESVDDVYVTVANAELHEPTQPTTSPVATTTDSDHDTSTTEADTTTEAQSISETRISVNASNSNTEFTIEVAVTGAEKVKVYSQKKLSTTRTLLGYAYQDKPDLWKYRWSTTGVSAGEYILTAYALRNGKEYKSNEVVVPVIEKSALTDTQKMDQSTTTNPVVMKPEVTLVLEGSMPISGTRTVRVGVADAESVELYLKPKDSLVQKYLGKANRVDRSVWTYTWNSTLTPNGEYTMFAIVKNVYGTYSKESSSFKVGNQVTATYTESQQKTLDTVSTIDAEPITVTNTPIQTASTSDTTKSVNLLEGFEASIDEDMQRLAAALRSNDPYAVERANQRLEELKRQVRIALEGQYEDDALQGLLDAQINEAVERTKENVKRVEKVIVERTGENIVKDSDRDGISDYDEVNIYGTDPFIADTDGDGFNDGDEILGGFDPLDPESETIVAYESPKERGIVREDILVVEAVITATKNEDEPEDVAPAAIITGKALPNSFVSLYIFSTPIVVTVKTDTEGNWAYRFDKELEDGTHEVYVGVTDNAGKLVAKSNPFTFVKEAQAYNAIASTQTPPPVANTERSIVSQGMIYLVLSISVVAIGLVLILLGLYLERRPKEFEIKEASPAV